ncbi:hypothetical protein SEVIR_5G291450v4 [Setaria viridis]
MAIPEGQSRVASRSPACSLGQAMASLVSATCARTLHTGTFNLYRVAVHETKSSTAIERALSSAGIRVTTRLTSHVPRPGHFVVYVRAKQRRRACERDVRGRIGVIGVYNHPHP